MIKPNHPKSISNCKKTPHMFKNSRGGGTNIDIWTCAKILPGIQVNRR